MEKIHSHGVPPEGALRIKMDADDGEVHHDGGHRNPPPQAKSDGEPPMMCVKGTDVPQSLMGSVSTPPAIWMSESIIYRDGGGPM